MRELAIREKDLMDRVIKKPELQPFFFRKLKGLHWFNALNDNGFLAPEKNPKPLLAQEEGYINIPHWPVTEYLVATSEELSNPDNEDYAKKFIELIRKITEHARNENRSNYRTWWQLAKVIRNVPVHLIGLEDLDLVDYWLDDPFERGLVAEEIGRIWLPELLEKRDEHSQQIALRVLDCVYKVIFVDKKTDTSEKKEPKLRYDCYYAKIISQKVAKISGLKLGLPAVELFQNRLISVLNERKNDSWSSIWRRAIEEHEQNSKGHHVDDIMVAAYRDCLLGFAEQDAPAAATYIKSLLEGNDYQTLKRVAIYAIDNRYSDVRDLSDIVVAAEYFHDNFRHELWHFLKNHYKDLRVDQQKRVIEIIEGLKVINEDARTNEVATAYKRSIWLSPIKNYTGEIAGLYKTYTALTKMEPQHPDFSSYMKVGWVEHISPIPVDLLLTLNVEELVNTLNSYKDTGPGWYDEPRMEGLVKAFKQVIKAKAIDIYRELMKFKDSNLAYVHPLIEAYRELWNEKQELRWNDLWPYLLDFCKEIINRGDFWTEEGAKETDIFVAKRHWIVGEIGHLIEDGTKSDEHAFDKSLLPKAKEILFILLERQEGSEFKIDSDAVSVAINSPRGRCLEAIVNLSLRSCRLEDQEINEHTEAWRQYEGIYDAELKRSTRGEYEFITLVATYLPNFYYMSSQWIMSHLSDIFNQSNYQQWLCAMQGYSYINNVYELLYKHLAINGDFLKALDDQNLKKQVHERIIEQIVVAFVNDFENIAQPDSLIATLIQRKKIDELNQLIWFFWTMRDKEDKKLEEKVFELWPRLLELVDVASRDGRILASNLCHWAAFIDKIDATVEGWLLKIAPYADENHNASDLLHNLAEISKTQPMEAQKIWLRMLESYSYDYPQEAIRQIFDNLIALGPDGERKAKEVVDAYLRHGLERPRMWMSEARAASIEKS